MVRIHARQHILRGSNLRNLIILTDYFAGLNEALFRYAFHLDFRYIRQCLLGSVALVLIIHWSPSLLQVFPPMDPFATNSKSGSGK
jgi:hypothetical protein